MKVAVVTSFPDDGAHKSAIAYYSKTILDPLRGGSDDFVILADAAQHGQMGTTERYAANMIVRRCWKFGYFAPFQILREALKHRVDVLHLEYDVYLYGGVVSAVLLPFVLRLLRLLRGVQVVTTLHGVVSQRVVTREMLRENGFVLPYSGIGRAGFAAIYRLFDWASDRIVVLEVKLAEILQTEYAVPLSKVCVCPIPLMHEGERPSPEAARRRCGIGGGPVALFFGYASYYKGLDVLLDAFSLVRSRMPDLDLHIVAGRHPRLRGSKRYEEFYEGIRGKAEATGAYLYDFVPEDRLTDLLAACDVVVLPYTATYGASAALNAVFAARKPVLVSTFARFDGALDCQTFAPSSTDCARAVVDFFSRNEEVLTERVEEIARRRDVDVIARSIQDVRCGRQPAPAVPSDPAWRELAEAGLPKVES